MIRKIFSAILFLIMLYGCDSRQMKTAEIEIVIFSPLDSTNNGHFPTPIQELIKPLEGTCTPKANIVFDPIVFSRVDINQKQQLQYKTNKATDYTKIKAVERSLRVFMEDSLMPKFLLAPQDINFAVDDYINGKNGNENYVIFKTSDDNTPTSALPKYGNMTDLKGAISKLICEKNLSKIYILYEPQRTSGKNINIDNKSKSDSKIDTPPPHLLANGLKQEILDVLMHIRDTHNSGANRLRLANDAMHTTFSKDFYVIMHNDDARALERIWERGDGIKYLKRIATDDSITGFEVLKVETNTTDNKVSHIEIVEKHNK